MVLVEGVDAMGHNLAGRFWGLIYLIAARYALFCARIRSASWQDNDRERTRSVIFAACHSHLLNGHFC